MEALGRLFNVVPTADGVEVNLKDASGVTFICVGADTYTIQSATDAAGTGAADLDVVDRWYTNTAAVGATTWALATRETADAAVTIAAGVAAIHVDAKSLPDGAAYVDCTSTATGLVYAIVHDLAVQRDPANLPAPAA